MQCGPMVHAVVRRIVNNSADADDVLQDAFVEAYRHWGDFRGKSNPCTWLHTIAVRAALRRGKREARRRTVVNDYAKALPMEDPRLVQTDFQRRSAKAHDLREEARARVGDAISQLPAAYRAPIVLKEIAALTVEETAKILGLKVATVKTRLHRGRFMLRQRLLANRPRVEVPPPIYDRAVCMDLLRAKMDALDRGVDFPLQGELVCERCRQVLTSLDVGSDACMSLRSNTLPAPLAAKIRSLLESEARARSAKHTRSKST